MDYTVQTCGSQVYKCAEPLKAAFNVHTGCVVATTVSTSRRPA